MALTRTNTASKTLVDIFNRSFDRETDTLVFQALGYDGVSLQRGLADSLAIKVTTDGDLTYIGLAAPGTAEATEKWQCFCVDSTTGVKVTYADGNSNFDNTATDLTGLSYS